MFTSTNGRLACKPFVIEKEEQTQQKGFATNKRATTLLKTNVVFADDEGRYNVGDLVYFRPEVVAHAWAKEVYELDLFVGGNQVGAVVFLPKEFVVLKSNGAS